MFHLPWLRYFPVFSAHCSWRLCPWSGTGPVRPGTVGVSLWQHFGCIPNALLYPHRGSVETRGALKTLLVFWNRKKEVDTSGTIKCTTNRVEFTMETGHCGDNCHTCNGSWIHKQISVTRNPFLCFLAILKRKLQTHYRGRRLIVPLVPHTCFRTTE